MDAETLDTPTPVNDKTRFMSMIWDRLDGEKTYTQTQICSSFVLQKHIKEHIAYDFPFVAVLTMILSTL